MVRKKTLVSILVVGALSAVATLSAITYQTVYAQEPTPTQETPTDANESATTTRPEPGKHTGVQDQDLADALGIDLATLQAAQTASKEKALQQAVDQGLITQEQADEAKEGSGGRGRGLRFKSEIDYDALLAEALGISTEQLEAAQLEAYQAALDRAVANGDLTQEEADLRIARKSLFASEQFQSSMQSAFESAVQQGVENGLITQEQADQILSEQSERGFFMGGHGGMDHRGGHGPRGDASQSTDSSE